MVTREIIPLARRFNERNAALRVAVWSEDPDDVVLTDALTRGLIDAARWSVGGLAVGFVYMSMHLRSPLLTLAGLFGLFVAFPLTWFLYTALFGLGQMGIFNFMVRNGCDGGNRCNRRNRRNRCAWCDCMTAPRRASSF